MTSEASDEAYSPTQQHQANLDRISSNIQQLQNRKEEISSALGELRQHLEISSELTLRRDALVKALGGLKKAIKKLLKQKKGLEELTSFPDYPDLT